MAVAGLGALFTRAEVISWRWKENRRDQAKCGKVCFAPTVTVSNRGTTCPDGHKRTSIRCPPLPPCPRSRLTRTSSHVRFAGATTNGVVVGPISSPGCVSSTARLSCNPFLGHGSTLTSRISSGRSFRRSKYDGLRRGFATPTVHSRPSISCTAKTACCGGLAITQYRIRSALDADTMQAKPANLSFIVIS